MLEVWNKKQGVLEIVSFSLLFPSAAWLAKHFQHSLYFIQSSLAVPSRKPDFQASLLSAKLSLATLA